MRDSRATSWLNMGAAAARAGDTADARHFLERALMAEPNLDEKTQIWYWLSRVTDDPSEKRRLLQDVIISQPGHAEARREMALLDGRLKAEDLADLRQPVGPRPPQDVNGRRYTCPRCGGRLAFSAQKSALACGHCGYLTTGYHAPGGDDTVDEHEFLSTLGTVKGHTWELPAERRLGCEGCGAAFTLPPGRSTAACPFCGSPHVAEAAGGELIAPEAVLPFAVDAGEARRSIVRWLAGEDGGPRDLPASTAAGQAQPFYLPFWTFGIIGEVTWQGMLEALFDSALRQVTGAEPVLLDNLVVAATNRLPEGAFAGTTAWDLTALKPYSPDLLADWPVEIYQIPLAEASLAAREGARAVAIRSARSRFPAGHNVHGLAFDSTGIVIVSFKLVLLPVWLAVYRVEGREFLVAVNGQTGKVRGRSPRRGICGMVDAMLCG